MGYGIVDSPPLVAVTDATMISKEIDNILIVVKVGKTEKNAFEHTINALKNISAPLGGILNAVTDNIIMGIITTTINITSTMDLIKILLNLGFS